VSCGSFLPLGRLLIVLGECYILPMRKSLPSIARMPQLERKGKYVELHGGKTEGTHYLTRRYVTWLLQNNIKTRHTNCVLANGKF